MASKALPSPEVLRQLLRYEPDTGRLFWRERGPEWFPCAWSHRTWNGRYAGRAAFTAQKGRADGTQYHQGSVLDVHLVAHRVIWAMECGCWPECAIDHRDGDGLNNRWCNLRKASGSQNQQNKGCYRNNTSGHKGVVWASKQRKWTASIMAAGKRRHLGSFFEKADAAAAYARACAELHGDFGRAA